MIQPGAPSFAVFAKGGIGECAPQSKHGLLVDDLSPTLGYAKDGAPVLFCLGMDGDGVVDVARTFWVIYRFPAHF